MDPTSILGLALTAAYRRDPAATVGYTQHHAALETISGISSMFARWLTDFQLLYDAAKSAQDAINAGRFERIDSIREVTYHDGDVEAFLAAVGSLTDGNISYPVNQTIDVTVIYERVMSQLEQEIEILDHIGYSVGEAEARRTIGKGNIPRVASGVACYTPETYDNLISSPWKMLLAIPRARDTMREQFESRLTVLLESGAGGASGLVELAEGNDSLIIPREIDGVLTTWDSLTAAIDGRPKLTTMSYQTNGGVFVDSWLNQFYTKGDLVEAILSGDVDVTAESLLSVLLAPLIKDVSLDQFGDENPIESLLVGPVSGSTGALSSYNLIDDQAANYISGTIDVVMGSATGHTHDIFTPLVAGLTSTVLPNGILQLGSCGAARATNWITILRNLNLNMPQEVKLLLLKSGRSKTSLPKGVNSISSMDSILAEALSNGQRDGYINSPSLAFNVTRNTRNEQEGPLFAGGTASQLLAGSTLLTPVMASAVNDWDRADGSDGRYLITSNGHNINLTRPTPSRFTGQWDAGRIAVWASDFVADSVALGTGNIEAAIADNLLSFPGHSTVEGQFTPSYIPAWDTGESVYDKLVTSGATLDDLCRLLLEDLTVSVGYESGLGLENYHGTRGFTRGLAVFIPKDPSTLGNRATPADLDSQYSRGRLTIPDAPDQFVSKSAPISGSSRVYDVIDADQPLGRSGSTQDMEAPACHLWHWDPARLQAFGLSMKRWGGHQFGGILPHPYALYPVAVSTAAMRLNDIVGVEELTESPVGATLGGQTLSDTWTSLLGVDAIVYNIDTSVDGLTDSEWGLANGLTTTNKSSAWQATMNNTLGGLLNVAREFASDPQSAWDPLGNATDSPEVIPTWETFFSTMNGCQRIPFNHAASVGAAGDDRVAGMSLMTGDTAFVGVPLLEGENIGPTVSTAGERVAISSDSRLAINGKGILFEGDVYTSNFLKLNSWMIKTYSGDQSLVNGPVDGFWAPYIEGQGMWSVGPVGVGSNFNASANEITVLKPSVNQGIDINIVQNDWFRRSSILSPQQARMRSHSLINPWIRASGESGYVHMRYENSAISPIYTGNQRELIALGRKMQVGLTNSLFLEVQTAN